MEAQYFKHTLNFISPGGTSRGVLHTKDSWILRISDDQTNQYGIGECSIIEGLNPENAKEVERIMTDLCAMINHGEQPDVVFFGDAPSVHFSYEMAMKDLHAEKSMHLFDCPLLHSNKGILINGLVWMGSKSFMLDQVKTKIGRGFRCIKIKVAAIDFQDELDIIKSIRREYNEDDIVLRLDANGGFSNDEALEKLKWLSDHGIHSIEQPIKAGQLDDMSELVSKTPIDIALDEELIGLQSKDSKEKILKAINPHFIILKPSLVGGFEQAQEWINQAENNDVNWWVTSALESNIGLSAIAQWTSKIDNGMYQGLGTGQLFSNNFESPLYIDQGSLFYGEQDWNLNFEDKAWQ